MNRYVSILFLALSTVSLAQARQFGTTVALDGDTILVGDGGSPAVPGTVYVFRPGADGLWSATERLSASDANGAVDRFGAAVAVDGDVMVVGAPGSNKAYIFSRAGTPAGARNGSESGARTEWIEVATLTGDRGDFGYAVAIFGSRVFVSAKGIHAEQEKGVEDAPVVVPNSVTVFEMTGDRTWTRSTSLTSVDAEDNDGYGSVLSAGEDRLFVSAAEAAGGAGAVYVYQAHPESGEWGITHKLESPSVDTGDAFGSSLLHTDGTLFIGAPGHAGRAGTVFMFKDEMGAGDWRQTGQLSPFTVLRNARFGESIALAGNQLWVGAPGFGGRQGAGGVFEFDLDGESLSVTGSRFLETPLLQDRSQFGASMAVNGRIAVIGAPGYDNRAGVAFPVTQTGDGWRYAAPVVNDIFGYDSIAGSMTTCEENEAGDFPCKDVDMMSFLSMGDLGADRGIRTNDLWGWEDTETGREYAIVGLSNQTSFVDVSDPYNPIFLGELDMPVTANMSVWRDMKVYRDHAYIVSDGAGEHGIQIFDLRQLRNVVNPPVVFEETAHYPGIFSAHNIVINEETGFAYAVGSSAGGQTCGGGLHMIDLSKPSEPVFAGCFTDGVSGRRGTGYSHDAQCVVYHGPDLTYQGHEICIGANETAISIADVTDKAHPVGISMATYPGVAYAHQGWLTDDHRYFYLNDELDEAQGLVEGTRTLIWDFSDLDEPELAGEFVAKTTETDHNLYVKGDLMYQSNTAAGLRILDISDPEAPFETAYFDTSPVGGRGVSWSNYPFFKSGIIVVTGGHYGLFILQKKEVDI